MRTFVGTKAEVEAVRVAVAQGAGYLDASGVPIPCVHQIVDTRTGEVLASIPSGQLPPTMPVSAQDILEGDDGQCALELPDDPEVNKQLGKKIGGVSVPAAKALVTDETKLPASVVRAKDDALALALSEDELIARLGPARAAAAKTRTDNKKAVARALGR